jgi:4-amino-4-deoxy-L-arabinose transferase-like glycosyltransferase
VPRLPRSEPSRWGGRKAALLGLIGFAAALRLVGVRYGLPFPVLNPDEQDVVSRAWAIANGGGLDPEWYEQPTLVLYALAPFQSWQDEPSYLAARFVIVTLGVAAVAATWWLATRAYGPVAGFVAGAVVVVATTHVAYSRMAVPDVPLTGAVALALALMVAGRLEWAGLAVGLAASVKYPGLLLLVPLVVVGWRRWLRLAGAGGLAVSSFAATSFFVVAHPGKSLDDAFDTYRRAREGALGFENDYVAPIAFIDRLWDALGPVLLVGVLGLGFALARRHREDLVLVSFVLAYFAMLLPLDAHFDRYVLPLVPPLAAFAGRVRWLAPVTLLLLVVPLVWTVRDTAELTKTDTRVVVERWIAEHIPSGAAVAADPSTPPLRGRSVLRLSLPGPSRRFDSNRELERLRARGVRYVVVSGAVADAVRAASGRYRREARFYDELARERRRVYRVEPDGRAGPWVAVYRL